MSKLTNEDKLYWKAATRTVKKKKGVEDFDLDSFMPVKKKEVTISTNFTFDVKPKKPRRLKDLVEGEPNHLDGNSFEKLRKGKIRISARIDLHGYKLDQAVQITKDFIIKNHKTNKRMLLIITGKSGKIKQEFPHWMNLPEISNKILSFTTAASFDGGTGAYYVYLGK